MAKELPYFQFEPAEYMSGSIQFCSLAAQGLFINILSVYWQRSCELTIEQVNRRFHEPALLDELVSEKIIKIDDGKVSIQFLYNQFNEVIETSKKRSDSGKKGMQKRWSSDNKPITNGITKSLQKDNKPITIREDKIKVDKIRENISIQPFSEDFRKHWEKWITFKKVEKGDSYKATSTEQTAFDDLVKISEGNEVVAEELIRNAIAKNWKGIYKPADFNKGQSGRKAGQWVA